MNWGHRPILMARHKKEVDVVVAQFYIWMKITHINWKVVWVKGPTIMLNYLVLSYFFSLPVKKDFIGYSFLETLV